MNMEAVLNAAASYQGSGTSVDKKQNTSKATITLPERKAPAAPLMQAKQDTVEDTDSATAEQNQSGQTPEKVSDSSLKKAVEDINRQSGNTEAVFGYHEGTKRVTIKIIDKETREVKKEYPPEQTLDMIQKIWEMAGLMVDEKG